MSDKRKNKLPVSWVVVIRCNLDDVIVGSYPKYPQAYGRLRQILKDPSVLRERPSPMDRIDDSGLIAVALYRTQGDKSEWWSQEEFGDEAKAA